MTDGGRGPVWYLETGQTNRRKGLAELGAI